MQIKRFEAKNMTTALRIIKGELGPEAIILSARTLRKGKGLFDLFHAPNVHELFFHRCYG